MVFRYDDFSSKGPLELENRIVDAFRDRQMAFTFGVIPALGCGDLRDLELASPFLSLTPDRVRLLRRALQGGRFEVALHGYTHQSIRVDRPSEFVGLSREQQRHKIKAGLHFLQSELDVRIRTFIPPWNGYDSTTVEVLEELGFNLLSARWECVPETPSQMSFLPGTCNLSELRDAVTAARKRPLSRSVIE